MTRSMATRVAVVGVHRVAAWIRMTFSACMRAEAAASRAEAVASLAEPASVAASDGLDGAAAKSCLGWRR